MPRWPILLASCVFVLGVSFLWVGPESVSSGRCLEQGSLSGPEAIGSSYGVSVWPPGTSCESTFSNGTQTRSTYVPWVEWLVVAVLALAVGAMTSLGTRTDARPSPRLTATIGVLTLAIAALFAGPGAGLILLALGIPAAVWLIWSRRVSDTPA